MLIIKYFFNNIRYLTLKKIRNYIKLYFSYFLSLGGKYKFNNFYPAFVSVEPANFCQLSCPECPVGINKTNKKANKVLSVECFKKNIDELKTTLVHAIFYFQGEPFLNKNLAEMIRYAHDSGIYTSSSTNAQLITERSVDELVLSGLDKLIISIDGTTQDVYEKYRIGGSLNKALKSIELLVEAKKRLKSLTPLLEIQFLVLKTNEDQIDEIKRMTKTMGADKLSLKTAQLYDFENGHELLPSKERYARYKKGSDGKLYLKNKLKNHCWRLWSGAVINIDAEVLPCCFDKDTEFSFGNLNADSFYACWTGSNAQKFRMAVLKNRGKINICRNCSSKN